MKLTHALELAETQGAKVLASYLGRLEKEAEGHVEKFGEMETLAGAWKGRYTSSIRDGMLQAALLEAGSITTGNALGQAVRLLASDGKAELVGFEDENAVATVALTIENRRFEGESLKPGIARWLELNPHFAKAAGGGSGGKHPNAGGGPVDLDKLSATQLIARGLKESA